MDRLKGVESQMKDTMERLKGIKDAVDKEKDDEEDDDEEDDDEDDGFGKLDSEKENDDADDEEEEDEEEDDDDQERYKKYEEILIACHKCLHEDYIIGKDIEELCDELNIPFDGNAETLQLRCKMRYDREIAFDCASQIAHAIIFNRNTSFSE
jgi:hypothetical protein